MIVRLDEPAALDIGRSGGKGRALAEMIAGGLPVPPGFVVTTDAFAAFCRRHAIDAEATAGNGSGANDPALRERVAALQARIRALPLPDELAAALTAALQAEGGDAVWAVRSSAVAEDSQAASFAGQFDTVLGVSGTAAVGAAIRHCWASFFHPEALLYKRNRGIHDERMAVVVQRLVEATASGVCFSLNPVSGARDEVVINANVGLGESVVGGAATPDTFIAAKEDGRILSRTIGSKLVKTVRIDGGSSEVPTTAEERSEPSLSPAQVAQLVELVRTVEAQAGHAVDVEWAFAGHDLYLLQSRPVTAAAAAATAVPTVPPPGWIPSTNTQIDPRFPLHTNGNIGEILPGCITPLTWSRVGVLIDYAFTKQYHQLGVIDHEPDPERKLASLAFFYGRPYICISYFTEAARATPGLTPDIYLEEFVGRPETPTPPFGSGDLRPRQIVRFLRLVGGFLYHMCTVGRDVARARRSMTVFLAELADDRLPALASDELLDRLAFNPATGHLSLAHVWVSTFASAGFAAIRGRTRAWLGDDSGTGAAALVTGIGVLPSAEPAFGIHALARRVAADDDLGRLFADPDDARTLSALCSSRLPSAAAFGEALDAFLAVHGHRGICEAELRTECWRDDPTQVIAMIRNSLRPDAVPPEVIRERQNEARIKATRRTLARLSPLRRGALAALLALTRRFIYLREELKNLITLREDRARRVYRLVAKRLVAEERLRSPDDVYFLTAREVRSLVAGTSTPADAQRTADLRRQEFEWCRQLVMPKLIDGEAMPVTLETLSADRSLSGIGVYPGRVEGRARVILDPRLDAAIAPGEILVAPVTDAGWTPLFIHASGLVVEVGGLLSHGSVVAREYGLPAVVGVDGATRRIRSGDRIAVDGAAGRVFILDDR